MKPKRQVVSIDISALTIVKIVALLAGLVFLYMVREVIAILFVSIILTAALNPWINWLQKKRIPRGVGLLFTYLILLGIIALALTAIAPPVIEQINQFAKNLPAYYEKVSGLFSHLRQSPEGRTLVDNMQSVLQSLGGTLQATTKGVFSTVTGFLGGLVSLVLVLVVTFYLASHKEGLGRIFDSIAIPHKYRPYLVHASDRMQKKVGAWLKGQLVLMLIIGLLCYVGLLVLGVKYALVLALIAGLTEIIPYIGPWIGGSLAAFVAFVQSPFLGVSTVVLYAVIQQLENHILVPRVMKKAVGLNPVVVILSIIAGAKVGGVVGALIAVPVVTASSVVIRDFFEMRRGREDGIRFKKIKPEGEEE